MEGDGEGVCIRRVAAACFDRCLGGGDCSFGIAEFGVGAGGEESGEAVLQRCESRVAGGELRAEGAGLFEEGAGIGWAAGFIQQRAERVVCGGEADAVAGVFGVVVCEGAKCLQGGTE